MYLTNDNKDEITSMIKPINSLTYSIIYLSLWNMTCED